MRQIGDLPNEEQARRFGDYLLTLDINGMVELEDDRWAVWVFDEDDVERARSELDTFQEDPEKADYRQAPEQAQARRREELRELTAHRKRTVDVRQQWQSPLFARTPVTAGLILISVLVVAVGSNFDGLWRLCDRFEYTKYLYFARIADDQKSYEWASVAFLRGEIHRLITPIFLHFSILHLLFNMMWLRTLGGAIEMRRGSWRFAMMVLFIAVTSNVAQYLYKNPLFGGMSGVDFGLFGYLWMKSRYDPDSGFFIPPQLVFMMMAWMVFCYFGPLNIANAAHTVGLIAGAGLGLWTTFQRRVLNRR